ncbi:hypothetical protein ECO9534_13882 [Escherichia coli O111:H11 str. CVM9534]|nr:hypothetical protein ECO9534_13882 [Escherichia coli O111:H11 str. CVM9534]
MVPHEICFSAYFSISMNRDQPGILVSDLGWRCVLVVPFTQREDIFMRVLCRSPEDMVQGYHWAMLPVNMAGNAGESTDSGLYPAFIGCE